VTRDSGLWRWPSYLLQHLIEIGREGVQDLSSQSLSDLVDVVEQLGGRSLGVFLQEDQAGVESSELLVGSQGSLIRGLQLQLCFFTGLYQPTWSSECISWSVLPQHIDLGQQLDVGVGHVEALQRVQDSFKARHGVVARI
jgi:hypothetical protein